MLVYKAAYTFDEDDENGWLRGQVLDFPGAPSLKAGGSKMLVACGFGIGRHGRNTLLGWSATASSRSCDDKA